MCSQSLHSITSVQRQGLGMKLIQRTRCPTTRTKGYLRFSKPSLLVKLVELDDDGGVLIDDNRVCSWELEQTGGEVVVHCDVGRDAVLCGIWSLLNLFFTPFHPYITLVSLFCPTVQMALMGFLPKLFSFYLPCDKYSCWSMWWRGLWVRECTWQGYPKGQSTKIFGCVRLQTPADRVAGNCFIHCAIPLRHDYYIIV